MKKFYIVCLMLAIALAMGACGGADDPALEQAPPEILSETTPPEADIPERDLGGMVINISQWWQEECTETAEPDTPSSRARWNDRREMEERYNFRIRYVRYGSWHDVRDDIQPQILAGNRDFTMWVIEPTWFATHQRQNLFAPIPLEFFDDPYGITWNTSILEMTKREGVPHGFASGIEMAGGLYFNKRLLEEAGFDRDLPFTLQRDNNWTWDTFTDMLHRLSRDVDGDGIIDTWALTTFSSDFTNQALASNNAAYATIDPVTGLFVNATTTNNFFETIDWIWSLRQHRLAFIQDDIGGEWDAFVQMFNDGFGAFRSAGSYVAGNINPVIIDDFGFVAFPRGPQADRHYSWVTQNINVIPHFFSPQEVDDIMFALQKWIRPLEDDDPYDWIDENLQNHRDPRSVEETMVHFTRNPALQLLPAHQMMPGLGNIIGELFTWRAWGDYDASVIVGEAQVVWDDFIARANAQ